MYYDLSSGIEAGGRWAMSVYDIQEEIVTNSAVGKTSGQSTSSSSSGAGGSTNVGTDLGPVEGGERAFTVTNQCSQTIRIGSTGGR